MSKQDESPSGYKLDSDFLKMPFNRAKVVW